MKKLYGYAASAAVAFQLLSGLCAYAATPGLISYQGTLRKDGRLFSGTASMEFFITDAAGTANYWNSGSTDVVVSTGLFRYPLGTPNEAMFSNIAWKDVTPYVQMRVDGIPLPPEPLYASVYSLHAVTAESSTGTFTINGGDLRLVGTPGAKGIAFPDSTVQYFAPGWAVVPGLAYTSFGGSAGVGILSPVARLDVQEKAAGDPNLQFWRDKNGVVRATMTASGQLIADGALMRNLPAGADNMGDHVATTTLQMAGFPVVNAGAVTANGQITTYSSATVGGALGLGAGRIQLRPGVELSSAAAVAYGGVYVSSNVFLPPGARYYGDGSALTGVIGNIVDSLSATLGAGSNAGGVGMVNLGNVALGLGSAGARLDVQSGAGAYPQFWRSAAGTIVASMSAGGYMQAVKFIGDGSGLTGLGAADNLGNHTAAQNIRLGSYWLSSDGGNEGVAVNATGGVGIGVNPPTARLEVNDSDANTNTSGVKFTNFSCAGSDKLTVDVSGNLACSADQTGSGTGNLIDNLTDTLSAGNNAGAAGMVNLGDVAIGAGAAGTRLDVQANGGGYSQFWRSAGGTIVGSMSAAGYMQAVKFIGDGSGLTGLGAADNLGNHTATQNLRLGGYYLSNDGGDAGLSVDTSGDIGIGINPPTARLELNDGDSNAVTSGMKFTDFSCTGTQKLTVDVSGNLVCSADQTGSGSGNIIDNLSDTLGAGNNAGTAGMVNLGNVAIGRGSAATRLDVQTGAGGYSQIWRNFAGVEVASMSAAGVLYADGTGIRGLPAADNLGSHVLTQNLRTGAYWLSSDGTNSGIAVDALGDVGVGINPPTARFEINDADANTNSSGMKFTNFACTGTQKLTVDVSGNLICSADQTGSGTGNLIDNLTDTLSAGNNAGSVGIVNLGDTALGLGTAGTRLDVQAGAGGYSQFWRDSGGTIVASMSATGVLYGSAAGLRGLPGADNLGNHTAAQNLKLGSYWLSGDGAAAGVSVNTLGNVGIGINPATVRLEVNDADSDANTSGIKFSNFSCSGSEKLTADVSGNLVCAVDQTGSGSGNLVDNLTDTLGAGNNAGGVGIVNLGNIAVGLGSAGTRLDVQAGVGGYSQFWRDAGGTIVASMSATGVLYGDASGLRNMPAGGSDNLGNHTAAQNIRLGSYWLSSDGGNEGVAVNATGGVGIGVNPPTARFEVNDSDANNATSGVKFTNFSCSGSNKLTVDVSGNLVCAADQTGSGTGNLIDNLTDTLNAGNNAGAAGMVNLGDVAIGLGAAGARLDVQAGGGYSQFWRDSGGTVVASMSATGVLYASAAGLRGVPAADNLGNHILTKNLEVASNWISNDGSDSGLSVNESANVGIGINPATARLEVNDADADTNTSGVKFTNFACSPAQKLTVDVSGNLVCAADQTGSGTGNLIDTLSETLGAGNNAAGVGMINLGPVAIGLGSAGTSLDVQAGGGYSQFWRDAGGVIVASMSAAGVLYGDASGLRNLPAGGGSDNLGNHTATQNLRLGAYWLSSDGGNEGVAVNAAGGVGVGVNPATARFEVNDADADPNTSGMKFTNFSCTGSNKLTVDVSGNLVCAADQTGSGTGNLVDNLTETLNAGTNAGAFGMVNLGDVGIGIGAAGARLDVQAGAASFPQFWRDSSGVIVASMSAAGVLYADAAGMRNLPSANVVDTLSETLGAGNDAGTAGILNLGDVALGRTGAGTRLDIKASGLYSQFWRNSSDIIVASMSATGYFRAVKFIGDGSGLTGTNRVDDLAATLGAGASAGNGYIIDLSSAAIGRADAEASLDVQAGAGIGTYSQIWRDSGGAIQASMTATGALYADASGLRNLPAAPGDGLGNHIATQPLNLNDFMLINASTITAAPGEPGIAFSTTLYVGGNVLASGGVMLNHGPLLIGTQLPLAAIHISSSAGYSGDLVVISTGISAPFIRMTGGGDVYATKFHGDGSLLTGMLTSPASQDIDMSGHALTNISNASIASRLGVGNQASPDPSVVSMTANVFFEADITDFNVGVTGASLVMPTTDKATGQYVMGGNFRGGIPPESGVTARFSNLVGVKAASWANTSNIVDNAFGISVQNMQDAGTVTNNYGIYIDSPSVTGGGTITNSAGLFVQDQSAYGTTSSYNIRSAGANSTNYFEGTVRVGGRLRMPSKTLAQLQALVPAAVGEVYYCSNCVKKLLVSTGTAAGNFSDALGGTFQ